MKDTRLPNGLKIFHLNASETSFLYQEIFEGGLYLKHGITISSGDIVFDVGANIGLFSIWLHQKVPGAKFYAFEPIPEVYQILAANFSSLGISGRAIDCALADKTATTQFTYYPRNSVMSGKYAQPSEDLQVTSAFMNNSNPAFAEAVKRDPRYARHTEMMLEGLFQVQTVECNVKTISDILREEHLPGIDLLKVDVEKSEHEVLAGIADSDWSKIRQLVLEVHDIDGRVGRLNKQLADRGYIVHSEQDAMMKNTPIFTIYASKAR
jgi:FkbM family methyltransferase